MSYAVLRQEYQRYCILAGLNAMQFESNELILQSALAQYGHVVSADTVRTHLAWLSEQGLVSVREVGTLQVARLTDRGQDVAEGCAQVPGVKRPRPSQTP